MTQWVRCILNFFLMRKTRESEKKLFKRSAEACGSSLWINHILCSNSTQFNPKNENSISRLKYVSRDENTLSRDANCSSHRARTILQSKSVPVGRTPPTNQSTKTNKFEDPTTLIWGKRGRHV